jgi:hypothetical protein
MYLIGDDWAEEHHDIYVMDEAGTRLASRRLPEGLTGIWSAINRAHAPVGHTASTWAK